jgi:hypothetical protein
VEKRKRIFFNFPFCRMEETLLKETKTHLGGAKSDLGATKTELGRPAAVALSRRLPPAAVGPLP